MTRALADLQADWDTWHAAREEELRVPHGWLSLTTRIWLTPQPSAVEGLPGRWSATPDGVVVTAAAADDLVVRTVREPRRIDGTGLRLHFRDATSAVTTHPAGRIIHHGGPAADGTLIVDFNRTVNLPCAFTDFATCPLPPAQNRLDVAVEAGERLPAPPG